MTLPKDPIERAQYIHTQRLLHIGKPLSEETKRKMSLVRRGKPKSEEWRKKISEGEKRRYQNPEERKKTGDAIKGHPVLESSRKKISLAKIGKYSGENSPTWKGGISFEPYCPKFNNEFKERVRAFFGNICFECGSPQNGVKHPVHHVNFRKDACCNSEVIPLFVPLCRSCHTKTNHHREYWQQHFTEIINQYYGGKCYFTKEEMAVFL